jgi:hypothetical protein
MVLEVCTNTRRINNHVNVERFQETGWSYARQLKQARRVDGTGGQYDPFRRHKTRSLVVPTGDVHTDGGISIELNGSPVVADEKV